MSNAFDVTDFRSRISKDLKSAIKRRDTTVTSALRNVLHILDNTSAVAASGYASESEVPRRTPSRDEVEDLLRNEIAEMSEAAEEYRNHGFLDRAETLDEKANVITRCISYLP